MASQGKIGVIGAGALGIFYGARLFRAGYDVHFFVRTGYELVRQEGYIVHSIDGDFRIRPPVYADVLAMGPCDVVLVGLKSFANDCLPQLLLPLTTRSTCILTLQNGLGNEEAIASALVSCGHYRTISEAGNAVVGGTAFLCSHRGAPNEVYHTAHGFVRLAEFSGPPQPRTYALAAMFKEAGIDCEVRERLADIRWEKLVWNIPFNGLGVAAQRADTAAILADPELRRVAVDLMSEVLAAARSDGASIDPAIVPDLIAKTELMGAYRSSMQIDYEQGRPLEVESILGEPVRRARAAGIAVPKMEMLYAIVRRLNALRSSGQNQR